MRSSVTAATFNLHAGIDAWGRPFDIVDAVRSLGADVVLLQECWSPATGPSDAQMVADALGGVATEVTLASGRRATPHPDAPPTWGRPRAYLDGDHGLYLDSKRALPRGLATSSQVEAAEPGSWGIAIVTTTPVVATSIIPFSDLRRDQTSRAALFVSTSVDGVPWHFACVHMSHMIHGSSRQFRQLRRAMSPHRSSAEPFVLGGDMNAWGPVVSLQLPGFHRAVGGASWPSWRPHSQLDHLLVNAAVTVEDGWVVDDRSSDHRPAVARLTARHP